MINLKGRTVLVTGGSRGLGRAISFRLAELGAYVLVNYAHNKHHADETIETFVKNGWFGASLKGDITDASSIKNMIQEAYKICGKSIDTVINNATGPQPELSIEDSKWEDYLDQLNFFVKAPLLLTKELLPSMKEKGFGRIITIGSEVVQIGNPNFANYVTAKSAQLGMTRSWANELGSYGITVNLVNPGFIPVERHQHLKEEDIEGYRRNVPLQRMGVPNDIANTVAFLASEESGFITGQSISVNGGMTTGI